MDLVEFWTICSSNGIVLEKKQLDQLERYHDELIYWNKKVNLISRKDENEIMKKHILHSLSILKYIDLNGKYRCLDIGTGAGLPGIPLKIAKPQIKMLLVDSIKKKIKITDMFANHTGLKNIHAICSRAEMLVNEKDYIKHFDFIFSRAVSKLSTIITWAKGIAKDNAKIVVLKGGDLSKEISQAESNYPGIKIIEHQIKMFGANNFLEDQKKILICSHF